MIASLGPMIMKHSSENGKEKASTSPSSKWTLYPASSEHLLPPEPPSGPEGACGAFAHKHQAAFGWVAAKTLLQKHSNRRSPADVGPLFSEGTSPGALR